VVSTGGAKQMTLDLVMLANAVQVGLKILSARIMALLGLMMTFGLFAWAMWLGSLNALATAGAFAVVVFLPVLASNRRTKEKDDNE
jgi:hypothetical protein